MTIFISLLIFILGLWLSAFFSGSETGFYRMSFVRLSIDAHAGDRTAKRILWFVRHPSAFVATTLVGNNVANFLTAQGVTLPGGRLGDRQCPGHLPGRISLR